MESGNVRIRGPEYRCRMAKVFTREVFAPSPSDVLTVTDCYETFTQFCEARGMVPIERKVFRHLIAEIIREEFDLGLRHDVLGRNHRSQQGWKGLSARLEVVGENQGRN
jgi:hypothetical protein